MNNIEQETRIKYRDIINLERPVHNNDAFAAAHPKMDLMERAKIFAPFSALRGLNQTLSAKLEKDHTGNSVTLEPVDDDIDPII
ncbi:MAG: hypothetical protein IJ703_10820 [Eubacterium sp.]|nr:hypothetical protein [Eubacterium sp.]